MKDHIKKTEDELLVVHKPAPAVGHTGSAEAHTLPADVDQLVRHLLASSADERNRLLATIQSRFGNAFATRVVEAVRRGPAGHPSGPARGPSSRSNG
jgi:hypothetical protein